jgi:large subunit ribosomal protein L15
VEFPGRDSWEVFEEILEKCQIVTTPGAGFGPAGQSFVRISAFCSRENIIEACKRFRNVYAEAPKTVVAAAVSGVSVPSVASRSGEPVMKVFDWKVRGGEIPSLETIDLSNLKPAPGSHKEKTRKGRGISAGQGKTCGFGSDGQKARSGRSVRPGFEGGQNPLYRRIPKYVGRPMGPGHQKTEYGLIKLDDLNGCADGSTVDYASLEEERLVSKSKFKLKKVVSSYEALTTKDLTVKAHAFTESAKAAIEGNGGTCVVLPRTAPAEKDSESAAELNP